MLRSLWYGRTLSLMTRFLSIFAALLLLGYIVAASFLFSDTADGEAVCNSLEVVVKDSLHTHFINQQEVAALLKRAGLDPAGKPLATIDTEQLETELLKNDMISRAEAYKTPSGAIKLEIRQKIPILRVMSLYGNFHVDSRGGTMPVSPRHVALLPVASGYVEKSLATTDLYRFALFLQANQFWNDQIEQIYVDQDKMVELVPRVGDHRILLGSFDNFEEKLENLQLFYKQAIPVTGWEKYSVINLRYKDQIVCTRK
ncbi:hypothetical protein Barb6_02555 [Bacteroidales bacterium Barb6]|nr:hypothetical protein Barb6_02555 [Bacteroidales bacterium Barb6]